MDVNDSTKPAALCASPQLLGAFLRASRARSDDHVQSELSERSCEDSILKLFREWAQRDSLLDYCEALGNANSSEALVQPKFNPSTISDLSRHSRDQIRFKLTRIDPRVDSYGARDEGVAPSGSENVAADYLQSERKTESIIRDSTITTVLRRCGSLTSSPDAFGDHYRRFRENPL